MQLNFVTPTKLSLLDITSMGSSEKRGDDKTIGQFGSGLKMAIAILLRSNVDITIRTFQDEILLNKFTFFTENVVRDDKSKNLIHVAYDNRKNIEVIQTGFTSELAYDWPLYTSYRELIANCIDENGYVTTEYHDCVIGTVITLTFDEDNEFYEIYENRELYHNESDPLYTLGDLSILDNPEGFLKIYKQNILVYKDEKVKSMFAFSIKFGTLDERRILTNISDIHGKIIDKIAYSSNQPFLNHIISNSFEFDENDWLNSGLFFGEATDLVTQTVNQVEGEISTFKWILDSVKKRPDCQLSGRVLRNVSETWSIQRDVHINSTPEPLPVIEPEDHLINPFQLIIDSLYRYDIGEVEVKTASIAGGSVIADKFNKCIIIDDDFNIETDFTDFVVQHNELKRTTNIVTSLANEIVNLVKK